MTPSQPRVQTLIATLGLAPHPEGGFYRQIFKSANTVTPDDRRDRRSALTAIYFLLPAGGVSRWHRVRSDEVWTRLEGDALTLWQYDGQSVRSSTLGACPAERELRAEMSAEALPTNAAGRAGLSPLELAGEPVQIVPARIWQAAEVAGDYALVACFVGPGFEFDDFELMADNAGERARLTAFAPELARLL